MTALRERLAQMGEVARAAGKVESGAPWRTEFTVHSEGRRIAYHVVDADGCDIFNTHSSDVDCSYADGMKAAAEHAAMVHPDVAAALVAVADALRNAYDVGAVAEWIDVEGDGPKAALDALAAVLGVSAPPSRDGAVHTEKTEPGAVGEAAPSEARSAR